jgi:hypothetical protein
MTNGRKTYSLFQLGSAVLMILALMWLTISAPFVFEFQKELAKNSRLSAESPIPGSDEETTNAFGNSTEEKAPKSINSFSEEYLHDHHRSDHIFSIGLQYHKNENAGVYVAFHGELLVPPPNAA